MQCFSETSEIFNLFHCMMYTIERELEIPEGEGWEGQGL